MRHEDLDPILDPWTKVHGLTIFKLYRDEEVRYARIVDDAGNIFGIAVWPEGDDIQIGVDDHQTKVHSYRTKTTLDQLPTALEEAYTQVEKWITASRNTRTPVL